MSINGAIKKIAASTAIAGSLGLGGLALACGVATAAPADHAGRGRVFDEFRAASSPGSEAAHERCPRGSRPSDSRLHADAGGGRRRRSRWTPGGEASGRGTRGHHDVQRGAVDADPTGPGPGVCQFLGANYPVYYYCDRPQLWLPFGTADNPPYGSQLPAQNCEPPNQHNIGCP
jgi:hypothetical protein